MISVGYINKVAYAAWSSYLNELSPLWKDRKEFITVTGMLPPGMTETVGHELKSESFPLRLEDYASGAAPATYQTHAIDALNAFSVYHPTEALRPVLEWLRKPISGLLRCPWRVLATRAWSTKPGASGGPFDWHKDGMPKEMLKIMVYFTPSDKRHGGLATEDHRLEGPAGMWVLFYNSKITHSGIPPTEAERLVAEITLCPWVHHSLEPRYLGTNARYPVYPLMNGDECV